MPEPSLVRNWSAPLVRHGALWLLLLAPLSGAALAAGGHPLSPPEPTTIEQARALVARMKASDRGPYARIRWFCNDGTILPPQGYACRPHGGGSQHAEYSEQRLQLSALGFNVGTIFTGLTWEEFNDAGRRHQRLRELPLERYLSDIDDGWVLTRARHYRGRVQAEDEIRAGSDLLLRLLAERDWVRTNYLLAREVVRVVPHGSDTDLTRSVRRDVQELAASHPSAEPLRVEVHTAPTPATAPRIRRWADAQPDAEAREAAVDIADRLDVLFGASGRRQRLERLLASLALALRGSGSLEELMAAPDPVAALSWSTMAELRATIESDVSAAARLILFDLTMEAQDTLLARPPEAPASRAGHLLAAARLVDGTYGVGLLSATERAALQLEPKENTITPADYARMIRQLQRVPQWAMGAIRHAFAEPLMRYSALDSRASRFTDDLLRSSALLPLAVHTRILARDLQALSGVGVHLFETTPVGVIGLNAGLASGRLRLAVDAPEGEQLQRDEIVVLPETSAELSPVAGILTLGEGNPLSHVQLLARNFSIPNVAISPETLALLGRYEGQNVVLAVGTDGSVALTDAATARERAGDLLRAAGPATQALLSVPVPDLEVATPLPLAELHKGLSGRVVGPKAANLGELNRLFPGRVAPAVALPFGLFARYTGDASGIRSRLEGAYAAYRHGELSETDLARALEQLRLDIAAITLSVATRAQVVAAMNEAFGDGDTGVFVRSDTNVEDLPEFTGAGLSETLPNVVGRERQLDSIARVWASVLSPRAIAWRSNLLDNPADVYASVLLMQSVPASKSGVLITADLVEPQRAGLTVSTAWGIGGAVSGEAAGSLVLSEDGSVQLLSEAKAPYRRALSPDGGIEWLPAPQGPVLTGPERQALRDLAAEVQQKYEPTLDARGRPRPWDIEFGFVEGELVLFQIRPLVERGQQLTDRVLERFRASQVEPPGVVDLSAPPIADGAAP